MAHNTSYNKYNILQPGETIMIIGIHHIAIGVNDINKAKVFYCDAFGFEVVQEANWNRNSPLADKAIGLNNTAAQMIMLKGTNAFIELWQYTNPTPNDKRSRPCDYGYPHFALQVDDIEFEYKRLKQCGMEFVNDVVDFGTSSAVYGRDPFGNIIEIYEIRDSKIPALDKQLMRD
jgi:glyoxylase I family protein